MRGEEDGVFLILANKLSSYQAIKLSSQRAMRDEGRMGMKIVSSMQLAVSRKIGEGCDEG